MSKNIKEIRIFVIHRFVLLCEDILNPTELCVQRIFNTSKFLGKFGNCYAEKKRNVRRTFCVDFYNDVNFITISFLSVLLYFCVCLANVSIFIFERTNFRLRTRIRHVFFFWTRLEKSLITSLYERHAYKKKKNGNITIDLTSSIVRHL